MFKIFKTSLSIAAAATLATSAGAFSLLGPLDTWQDSDIGYNLGGDIGGPMNLGEEYRWNFPLLTYGFDESFLNYFGSAGTAAVHRAFAILNAVPPVSQMSSNLTEFPTDGKRFNFQASALNLLDMKSVVLGVMLEQMGLASPERWVWALRNRREVSINQVMFTNYIVIQRNFDPINGQPTPYVNDVLYSYQVVDFMMPQVADAQEFTVDPLAPLTTTAASIQNFGLAPGEFFDGITRDDAGGLRYLLRTNNFQFELLANGANLTGTTNLIYPPHLPAGTGQIVTNAPVNQAIRPGIDKISFMPHPADSLIGLFAVITNTYVERYVTNSTLQTQTVERVLVQPDVLFTAADLGIIVTPTTEAPVLYVRPTTATWQDNDGINGFSALAGPGVIQGPLIISLSKLGPYFFNQFPSFVDETTAIPGTIWGSFDGTANAPIVFPFFLSVQEIEDQILNP